MKKAMWKVDDTGRFEYSDRDTSQTMLTRYTQANLADDLDRALRGRTLSSNELKEYVLTSTSEYRSEEALKLLKARGALKQKRGEAEIHYTFSAPRPETGNLFGN